MEQLTSAKSLQLVERLLKKHKGALTANDAAAETGMAVHEARESLERLMELYQCRLTAREDSGDIVFRFAYPLRKRGSKTWKEIAVNVRDALWKAFVVTYKASIGIVLIVYTLIFIAILIAATMAMSSRDSDSDNGSFNVGGLIGGIFRAIFEGMLWTSYARGFDYEYDTRGMRYKRPTESVFWKPSRRKKRSKNFIRAVYDFVFGPERPQPDALENAKEAAAFVRSNNGKLTAGHLVALAGWTYDEAEQKLADYLVRFGGRPQLSDSGIVVGEYDKFLHKENTELQGGEIQWYQDEVDPPFVLNGNSTGINAGIIGMNAFNLIMSGAIVAGGGLATILQGSGIDIANSDALWLLLGVLPMAFSLLFFSIPLARIPLVKRQERRRANTVLRKKLIGVITSQPTRTFTFDDLCTLGAINTDDKEAALAVLQKVVVELRGDITLNDDGTPLYSFQRLAAELSVR